MSPRFGWCGVAHPALLQPGLTCRSNAALTSSTHAQKPVYAATRDSGCRMKPGPATANARALRTRPPKAYAPPPAGAMPGE